MLKKDNVFFTLDVFHPALFSFSTFLFHPLNICLTLYPLFDLLPFLFHPPSFGWSVGWLGSLMLIGCVIQ